MHRILVTTFIAAWMLAVSVVCMFIPTHAEAVEGKLKRFTLSNGLEILVKEDHARKVATIQFWVMVGSADEIEKERGISHVIEHMAFKGTERRGVGKIAAEVEALGGEMNAYTSWDETVFHVTVPSSEVAAGLDIVTDAVLNPVIDADELEKEKKVVLEEILEGEERPDRKASKLLFKTAYDANPYRYPIIGYPETVEKINRDDITAFRKKWYVPENMFLLVVGDVDAEKVRDEAERVTAGFKPVGFFRPPRRPEPGQKEVRGALLRDNNTRETRLHLAFHIPSMQGSDVNALDLAADILGARDSSRLVRILKKEKGLVNSVSAYALTPKEPGLMVISATLEAKNTEAVVRSVMEEIQRLGKEPPSKEELERGQVHIESQHIYARETVQGMARSIGSFRADMGDASYEEKYLALNRAVTAEQVSAGVRQYLMAPNASLSLLLPEDEGKDLTVEKLTKIVESFKPAGSASTGDAPSAEGAVTRSLPNGMKVVLMPDDSNPVVSVRIAHLGGKRFESRETEGIMNFIAQMLDKGTAKLSEVEISRKIEDMGGRLAGFSGYDSFGVQASFFSRYLDEGLQLVSEVSREPAFPKDKLERERTLIINRIKTEPDRPVQFAVNALNRTVFPDHPYGFNKEGTLATVSGFTPEDLKQTYQRYAVPSNTVITCVGDLDPEKTLALINRLFGQVPAKEFDKPDLRPEDPLTKMREKDVRIPRAKAHLAVGFLVTTLSEPDRYPLEVLNNILAGQGGRLFLQLRDKESLAYVVTSFFRPGLDPGVFAFYMACEEGKVDPAVNGLFRQIDLVRDAPVADEELTRSISNLIGNHLIALQSSWARAENTALNTLYGLGYDYDAEYVRKIGRVKAEDVLAAARKYLDPKRCAVVKILPEDNGGK